MMIPASIITRDSLYDVCRRLSKQVCYKLSLMDKPIGTDAAVIVDQILERDPAPKLAYKPVAATHSNLHYWFANMEPSLLCRAQPAQ